MSGPIIRKYGFPDFDRIFGAKPAAHGVDREEETSAGTPGDSTGQPADLDHRGEPVNPRDPDSAGEIAPSTEFGGAI